MNDRRANLRTELAARDQQARQQQAHGQTAQARATKQTALRPRKDALERRYDERPPRTPCGDR